MEHGATFLAKALGTSPAAVIIHSKELAQRMDPAEMRALARDPYRAALEGFYLLELEVWVSGPWPARWVYMACMQRPSRPPARGCDAAPLRCMPSFRHVPRPAG